MSVVAALVPKLAASCGNALHVANTSLAAGAHAHATHDNVSLLEKHLLPLEIKHRRLKQADVQHVLVAPLQYTCTCRNHFLFKTTY